MKLIVGNFKMNLEYGEVIDYIDYFKEKAYSNVIFAPSYLYLSKFHDAKLTIASQDVSKFDKGAYTGDVGAFQLKSMGVEYSIVGHSERRNNYQEDSDINSKIFRLQEQGIIPIICIGETKEEKDNGLCLSVLKKEIKDALKNIDNDQVKNIIFAYEPIWAIGTGLIPQNSEIEEVISFIKKYVYDKYLFHVKVLYGGSVNNQNIGVLELIPNIDGYLVGGCSINQEKFDSLIQKVK